ncbi:hypothetical protein WQ57_15385 [Mesobacillus campisalis]|uniref:Uncharacterized protein n=1 Tax=Mesobacillus campisalis TaxID=1408103 RepID=A0A0M2STR8_9BACI|nr:hypothetical protein WQ57_15385 [Mesobacillus campisalis]
MSVIAFGFPISGIWQFLLFNKVNISIPTCQLGFVAEGLKSGALMMLPISRLPITAGMALPEAAESRALQTRIVHIYPISIYLLVFLV